MRPIGSGRWRWRLVRTIQRLEGIAMVIAQALGEYGVVSGFVAGIGWLESGYHALTDVVGEWGVTGLGAAVVAVVFWKVLTRPR